MKRSNQNHEKGQALIVFTLGLAAFLGMVALVIDLGMLFQGRRGVQNSVDAAALAGARELPGNPPLAQSEATQWAQKNGLKSSDKLTVLITSTYSANDTISVNIQRSVDHEFANVLGFDTFQVSAQAKARVGSPAGMNHFVPLAALDSTLKALNPGDAVTLKYDSQTQTNGNSLALSFPGTTGASDFRSAIYNGSVETFCVKGQEYPGCTSTISTEPGSMVGPTQQAINDLLKATSAQCDTFGEVFSSDPSNPSSMLIAPACNPFPPYNVATSKQLIIIPVIDSLCNGRCDVHIIRFAMMFVNAVHCNGGKGTCQVTGQYATASFDPSFAQLGRYNGDAALKFARLVE